ncbi:BRCT domain-containing protein [Lysinibacillus sp. 54212]|uniref:BRCT domain-containing protein n=1 Tax=Lysinibacillus sp. 54212 TaxID=3119829 RepID=UPI002FCBBB27
MNKNIEGSEDILLSDSAQRQTHPFYNKRIVITGALSTMTRSEAAKKVRAFGGIMQGAVTQDTNFVILGNKRRSISTKQQRAEGLISLGYDIQMIFEDDFLWLLSMPKNN